MAGVDPAPRPRGGAAARAGAGARRVLNIDTGPLYRGGLYITLALVPLFRGLFFAPELLPAQVVVGFLALLWVLDHLARGTSPLAEEALLRPRRRVQDWGVIALFVCYAVTLAWAFDAQGAVREALKALTYMLVFLMAADLAESPRRAEALLQALVVGGALVALVGIGAACGVVGFPGAFGGGSIMSTLQYENALAGFAMALSMAVVGLWTRPPVRPRSGRDRWLQVFWRFVYAALGYMLVLVVVGTRSRGGWVIYPLAAGAVVAGMGRAYFWRALYNQFLVLSLAILVGKPFYGAVFSGEAAVRLGALRWFAGGLLVVLLGEVAYWLAGWLSGRSRTTDQVQAVLRGLGVAYVAVLLTVYFAYAVRELPLGWRQAVPVPVGEALPTVSLEDQSFLIRMYANRDALRIVRDHPWGTGGGGWNALYHKYQSTLYWTTEVHNHFLQVWVEAGTGGFLAFLAVWVGTGMALWRLARVESGTPRWPLAWGAGAAAFTLGAHSALDFDLSLPAAAVYLFVMLGVVTGLAGRLFPTAAEGARGERGMVTGRDRPGLRSSRAGYRAGYRRAAATGLAAVLAVGLMWSSARLYAAGRLGAEAAQSMIRGDLADAEEKFRRAAALDPFTATYAADLAQIYTAVGVMYQGRGSYYQQADEWLGRALRAQPCSIRLRMAACDLLLERGELDRAAREAETVLDLVPLATESWEGAARAWMLGARFHLDRGAPAAALAYVQKMLELPARMEKVNERQQQVRRGLYRGPSWTPALQLALGQARFLRGDFTGALRELEKVKGDRQLGATAQAWVAAAHYRLGHEAEADRIARDLTARDARLAEEIGRLREQPVAGY
ncbi:MAG: O-antigen ligase family protein [Bacillota bacterium]|nr:O-antigen ligase family protein [Bacillota bacterium]